MRPCELRSQTAILHISLGSSILGASGISRHGVIVLQHIKYSKSEKCSFARQPWRLLTSLDTVASNSDISRSMTSTIYQHCMSTFCLWANWIDEIYIRRSEVTMLSLERAQLATLLLQGSISASLKNLSTALTT